MKKSLLKLAVSGVLALTAGQAMSAFETLPVSGFAVVAGTHQPTGGTTAYK